MAVVYVSCHDEQQTTVFIGPFEDVAWARAWLKQHTNDIPEDEPWTSPKWADIDHYCLNIQSLAGDMEEQHSLLFIHHAHEPGFDPTTLPESLEVDQDQAWEGPST